jgi:S1-C subfamily serine protease
MNIIDILILLFLVSALVRGVELGLVRQFCSTAGIIGGLFVGAFIQGKLIHLVQTPASKALLVLCTILASIALFSSIGEYIGVKLKYKLHRFNIKWLQVSDRVAGSVMAGVTLLLAVWLGASIFSETPSSVVQRQIKNSVIISQLNRALPSAPDVVARLGHLIDPNGFPEVFTGLEPQVDTDKPLPSIGELDPAVQKVRASVVKVEGAGCGGVSDGSGFVADKNLVVTNAHVIAGVAHPYIIDGRGKHSADVIWFDPDLDMAVLRANDLGGEPLDILADRVNDGVAAAVLGYPGGGDFKARPSVVIESFTAIGRNIYNQDETRRDVYSMKADIVPGSSGGPVIDSDGNVIGLVFAESTTYPDVGYALTIDQVLEGLNLARDRNTVVSTGSCAR